MLRAALAELYGTELRKKMQLGNRDPSRGHRDYGICLATFFFQGRRGAAVFTAVYF